MDITARLLLRWNRFSLVWYPTVLLGWLIFTVAVWRGLTTIGRADSLSALTMCAFLLIGLELLPLVQGRGHDPQGVVMSTAFVCALLFMWGPYPAIITVCLAAIASDLRARKRWWKLAFNVGQYSLSVFAGHLVMAAAGVNPALDHPLTRFEPSDLVWMVGVWTAYFLLNLLVVVGVTSYGRPFIPAVLEDLFNYTILTYAVLGLSPVIVALALGRWWLLPTLLIPLLLLYWIAQMSLAREHEAMHDPLTGLANRTNMDFALARLLETHKLRNQSMGLLLIDLDRFKEVNDSLGHHVGDELLTQFARRLRHSVRDADEVVRLGGDEFAVLLPKADVAEAEAVGQRILGALEEPFNLGSISVDIDASLGLAIFPDHGVDASELLRLADVAMYDAKANRLGVSVYSAERDRNDAQRLSLLSDLRQALIRHELELHYQPKLALADRSILGVEALIRWHHPQRGQIPPDEFIPLAERSGLMPLLTESVVDMALTQATAWQELGLRVPIAVNVTLTDVVGGNLDRLIGRDAGMDLIHSGALQLELTERVMGEHTRELGEAMRRLQRYGVGFSLDDFGTGYSSLLRLQALPVDELKIDRAFISRLTKDSAAFGIVGSTIELAHALKMPAIAEGVETEGEWDVLRQLGCDGAQGWFIAKAMPAEQATQWIVEHSTVGPVEVPSVTVSPALESLSAAGGVLTELRPAVVDQ